MPTFSIAFSGHRPHRLPDGKKQLSELEDRIEHELHRLHKLGYDTVLCGMAEGADLLCYEAILSYNTFRPDHEKIRMHCVLPYMTFPERPSFMNRNDANLDSASADQVTVISPTYQPGCFHKRNRFMVDSADILLALYDGRSFGGTAYTMKYARQKGKEVIILHPFTLERTVYPIEPEYTKMPQT